MPDPGTLTATWPGGWRISLVLCNNPVLIPPGALAGHVWGVTAVEDIEAPALCCLVGILQPVPKS